MKLSMLSTLAVVDIVFLTLMGRLFLGPLSAHTLSSISVDLQYCCYMQLKGQAVNLSIKFCISSCIASGQKLDLVFLFKYCGLTESYLN